MLQIETTAEYDDWFDGLEDRNARARIDIKLSRARNGNFGDHKSVGGVMEMRIDYGPGYRVYYVLKGNKMIVLLIGGSKKTQRRDIKRAHELKEQYT